MKTTYGIILINKHLQILAVHPTRHKWNQWDIPKGIGDEGESPLETVKREFLEETNIDLYDLVDPTNVTDLTAYSGEFVYKSKKKKLHPFIGFMDMDFDLSFFKCFSMVEGLKIKGNLLEPFPEVDAFAWVDVQDFRAVFHESQVRAIDYAINMYPIFNEAKYKEVTKCHKYG